jgi:hypothetical protein
VAGQFTVGKHFVVPRSPEAAQVLADLGHRSVLVSRYESNLVSALASLELPPLTMLCPAKTVFAPGEEIVLLAAVPEAPRATGNLVISFAGQVVREAAVTLDDNGAALISFQVPGEGRFEAQLQVAANVLFHKGPTWSQADSFASQRVTGLGLRPVTVTAHFVVGQYRLSAVELLLLDEQVEADRIHWMIAVSEAGRPYEGRAETGLADPQGKVAAWQQIECDEFGTASGSSQTAGAGPFVLRFRLPDGRTAEVPVRGSARAERQPLALGDGAVVLPDLRDDARGLGFRVEDAPAMAAPVQVLNQGHAGPQADILVRSDGEALQVCVLDRAGNIVHRREVKDPRSGQRLSLDVPLPYGFVTWGLLQGEQLREGWTAVLAPSPIRLDIRCEPCLRPGQPAHLTLLTGCPDRNATVFLTIRDSRVHGGQTPRARLASSLREGLAAAAKALYKAPADNKLIHDLVVWDTVILDFSEYYKYKEQKPTPPLPGQVIYLMRDASTALREAPAVPLMPSAPGEGAGQPAAAEVGGGSPATLVEGKEDLLLVTKLSVRGEARLDFDPGPQTRGLVIEAVGVVGGDEGVGWDELHKHVRVAADAWTEFDGVPHHIEPGVSFDALLVGFSDQPNAVPELTRDQEPVPLVSDAPGRWRFSGGRGHYVAHIPGSAGIAQCENDVQELGRFRRRARRLTVLLPGERIAVGDGVLEVRPWPLVRPLGELGQAVLDYQHLCCEQTAAKIFAAVILFVSAGSPSRRATALQSVRAAIARLETMFLLGKGFAMYPGRGEAGDYWGRRAAQHLLHASALWQGDGAMGELLQRGHRMGLDAARAYGLRFAPPFADARAALLGFDDHRSDAAQYARQLLCDGQTLAGPMPSGRDPVEQREGVAYAAAILAREGDGRDVSTVLRAVAHLGQQLNQHGRLYSTVDSVGFLACLNSVPQAPTTSGPAGLDDEIVLDGRRCVLRTALVAKDPFNSIEALDRAVLVGVDGYVQEAWDRPATLPAAKINISPTPAGQQRLHVSVPAYEPGLLLTVYLPPALASIQGGTMLREIELDFTGGNELDLYLDQVQRPSAHQGLRCVLSNMFRENAFWCSPSIDVK